MKNMFKVNNKDTRITPAYLTPCSSVFIVNFEQANDGSEMIFSYLPSTLQYFLIVVRFMGMTELK